MSRQPKVWSWSFTKLKNYETCPKRHYHYDVARDVKEPESEELREGNRLHTAFELRLGKGTPLPHEYTQHEKLLARIANAPGTMGAETQLAITAEFQPTGWFEPNAWFRTKVDASKVSTDGTKASIFDWKTGKVKSDITQLQLMAATTFVHMPAVQEVRSALVFLGYDHVEQATFLREDQPEIWGEILPRVRALKDAHDKQNYPPRPSGICRRWCLVTGCPHYGKGW